MEQARFSQTPGGVEVNGFFLVQWWAVGDDLISAPETLAYSCDPHQSASPPVIWELLSTLTFFSWYMKLTNRSHLFGEKKKKKQQQKRWVTTSECTELPDLHISASRVECSCLCDRRSGQCGPLYCTRPPGAACLQVSGLWLVPEVRLNMVGFHVFSQPLHHTRSHKDLCLTSRMVTSFSFSFPSLFFTCVFLVSTHTTLSFTSDLDKHQKKKKSILQWN